MTVFVGHGTVPGNAVKRLKDEMLVVPCSLWSPENQVLNVESKIYLAKQEGLNCGGSR